MAPCKWKALVALGVSLFLSTQANAQPLFGNITSLESLVVQADVVVVGKIVEFDKDKRMATVAVEETLKGKKIERLTVQLTNRDAVIAHWKAESSRLMVTTQGGSPTAEVLDLTLGELEIMTADFTVLRKAEDALRVAKDTVRRLPGDKQIDTFSITVPREAIVGSTLGSGYSHLRLSVPVDERLEKRAIDYIRSKDYSQRKEGAEALGHFKSDANIARLKPLLNDPGFAYLHRAEENSGIEVRLYEVRENAANALEGWGAKVEKPAVRIETVKEDIERVALGELTAVVIGRLRGFKNLREVSHYADVTDDGLKQLATLTQVERLHLSGIDNKKVTDAGIKELKALTNLTVLDLRCPNLTDASLKDLASLKNLTTLDLTYANVDGSGLKDLAGLKNLTMLHLHNTRVNDKGLKELAPFTNLTTLYLSGTPVTNAGLKELVPLKNLTHLYLLGAPVTDAGLKELAPLKKLLLIDVYAYTVTDTSLRTLRKIDLLHALNLASGKENTRPKSADEVITMNLYDTKVTDEGLKELAALKNLTTLYLSEKVTDAGLRELAQCKNLTTLIVGKSQVSDAGLKHLTQLKNLTTLHLQVTDARLRLLRTIGLLHVLQGAEGKDGSRPRSADEVVTLNLWHTAVADEGLKELASLKNLTALNLYDTKVTDAGLKHLVDLPKLWALDLRSTAVTNAGLKHLEGLAELRELSLADTQVTEAGVFTLRKALPKCRITTK